MVQVRKEHPLLADGSVNLPAWLAYFSRHTHIQYLGAIEDACQWAQRKIKRQSTDALQMGLEMAEILVELKLDQDSIVAAILYRMVRTGQADLIEIEAQFGQPVAQLIQGVQGMAAITQERLPNRVQVLGERQDQTGNVRKMLVSIIDDVRVALIKLAERTCAIRALKGQDKERCRRVAAEVFDIYAPLAHRLGIGYIKWELEDLSFRHLKANDYKKIARLLDEKRLDRQEFIDAIIGQLKEALKTAGIAAEVHGRAKHIYSIWRKMRRKNADFRDLYDIRAFRVMVNTVPDCYATLGVIHSLWKHIPKEFDDYIATPKENGYRSLHTAVIGPSGKTMEVQIRTHTMHDEAELGVCAHWKYKGTDVNARQDSYEEKLAWLRQVMEWHEELGDVSGLAEQWRSDIQPDRIYVFTVAGHVIDLPTGATPLDFAYRIHTEVGNTCRGAKVGGRIVPLNHPLKTGNQVEILTASGATPSRDWLNPHLNYVVTSKARAKISHWLKNQDRDINETHGKWVLDTELKRLDIQINNYALLVEKMNFKTQQDLYAAIGAGDVKATQVINLWQRLQEPVVADVIQLTPNKPHQEDHTLKKGAVDISGVGNLLTQIAQCCHPLPGDPIIGYITLSRGVAIHRTDCTNVLHLQLREPARIIEVAWGEAQPLQTYPVEIVIEAYDRAGLLRDITTLLANEKVNVLSVTTKTDHAQNTVHMELTIDIHGLEKLGRILGRLNQLPNVVESFRSRKNRH